MSPAEAFNLFFVLYFSGNEVHQGSSNSGDNSRNNGGKNGGDNNFSYNAAPDNAVFSEGDKSGANESTEKGV